MATSSSTPAAKGFISTDPELAAVDVSVRWPVLVSLLTAVHWMVVGTFLLVYASSLAHPQDALPILSWFVDLSNNCSIFTYGRVFPAAVDSLVYGWCTTAGLGLAVWLIARTGRVPVILPGILMTGIVFWNLGVAAGLIGIFLGGSTSIELLEFPSYAAFILWIAYALVAVCAVVTYRARKAGCEHLSQAWVLVALFAFPWLYAAGNILLNSNPLPGSGVIQGLLSAWYVHGLYTLWLAPLGLGLLYYLIPKVSGLNIGYGSRASLAFWTWVIFAPWTAVHDLVGGPFPAETVTTGLIISGLLFIPVSLIGLNLIPPSLAGEDRHHEHGHGGGVVLPFLTLAVAFFVATGVSEQILSIRSANQLLRFTMFRECNQLLWIYGFFSFVVFGSMYYIVPRLVDFGWRSAFLIRAHYYASLYGILLVILMIGFGGLMQGFVLENSDSLVTIVTANQVTISYYIAATMCISLVSIGNGFFALHLGWMILDWLKIRVRQNRLASEILLEPYEAPASAATEVSA